MFFCRVFGNASIDHTANEELEHTKFNIVICYIVYIPHLICNFIQLIIMYFDTEGRDVKFQHHTIIFKLNVTDCINTIPNE